jgi:hypothetical protein
MDLIRWLFVSESMLLAEGILLLGGGVIEGMSSCAHFIVSYNMGRGL